MDSPRNPTNLVFSLLVLFFLVAQTTTADGRNDRKQGGGMSIGVIVDKNSRVGKEEIVAMGIAKDDVYKLRNQSIVLNIRDSRREVPLQSAFAAQDLINNKVQAILGLRTWEETSLVAEISSQNQVPVLSFADTIPEWATERWSSLLQLSPNKNAQTKAIADILKSWNWHQIALIHEDSDFSTNSIIAQLSSALREVNSEIKQVVALSPFSSLSGELDKLNEGECRVFVVHLSLPLAQRLFYTAMGKNMMEKDYVWIATDSITSLVHSINASVNSAMQGVLGLLSYFPEKGDPFQDFRAEFRRRFSTEFPEEDKNEPGIFGAQAYDAVWTVALALNQSTIDSTDQEMVDKIAQIKFDGLSGKFGFKKRTVAALETFRIVNVMGRSYIDIGYWTNGLGFSRNVDGNITYYPTMKDLGQVSWPGRPLETPRGWTIPKSDTPLKVGVPAISGYKDYVNVIYDGLGNKSFHGLAIEVFKETVQELQFNLPYTFVDFNGTYNQLVQQISKKNFDIAIGDITIMSTRYEDADFTHPYTETGLMLIVPAQTKLSNKAWLFTKPYTPAMWALSAFLNLFNGFVVWLIERKKSPEEFSGPFLDQIGTLLWLSFNTLFSLQGEKLKSNLSRLSMIVWLFVALIFTQTYTANLSSMLTVRRLVPTIAGVDELLKKNVNVGHCHGSYMQTYLVEVLHIPERNLRSYSAIEHYAMAFERKEISAAFLEAPLAKSFLSKYCDSYIAIGPTFKVGGYGFAVQRGSPLLHTLNEALLKVCESGKLLELEDKFIPTKRCRTIDVEEENPSLSPNSFKVLFIISGGISAFALLVYIFQAIKSRFGPKAMWRLMLAVRKYWRYRNQRFMRRVGDIPNHGNV